MTNASTLGKSTVETREVDHYARIEREIDRLFEEHEQETLASLKSSYAELTKDGQATEQEENAAVLDEERRFESLKFCGRVSTVTNNFWMWWKEG